MLGGGHGAFCVVTEGTLAVFPAAVPSGYETLAFSTSDAARDAALALAGAAPLSPLELAVARDDDRWLLHLWFRGPAACVAVGRDRATHGPGSSVALGEAPARAFWRPAAAVPLQPHSVSTEVLAGLTLAPGEFISGFSPAGAVHFALPGAPSAPVLLGESPDPRVNALLRASDPE